ncbi:CsbD family protein [Paenisporosarcina sp. OV554]|uniref:CsbD family protein n=1 Tax=Paenisporosarcina sp. OV554 TaxID=2135694 RepID=UPI000D3CEC2B|nr:CsbD family protein [Paenisporosarcina sp. OV554]PUB13351.1 CsbD-like protein [Paenisporosarcina sp. OV554]
MTNDNGLSDKLKAGVNKAKGEVKDQVGNATDDKSLQAEGKYDKAKGAVEEKIGEAKDRH